MTEPSPTYTIGEQLDPATRDVLARYYEAMRGDGISIVRTAERGLRDLGVEVETAVSTHQERKARRVQRNGG
jgi:hypothetical protein